MRWIAIKKRDGGIDKFAIGFATHTVASVSVDGQKRFEAWRLTGREAGEAVRLGIFALSADACRAVERDALNRRLPNAAEDGR